MGITERKEREKLAMRELILEAATLMFLEEGYEKTSIRNIAEKIEYSPATIYLYFKDKDELFFAIHQIGFGKLLNEMSKAAIIEDPLEKVRMIGRIYIEFGLANPEYYDLMFIMRAPMKALKEKTEAEQCWQDGEGTFNFLQSLMQECIDTGKVKGNDAQLLSMLAWSTVHGMVSLYIRERFGIMEMTEQELKTHMFKMVELMIAGMQV